VLEFFKNRLSQATGRAILGIGRFQRGMTLGVRAAIFDSTDRVFLVRHTYVPGWHFPGGGVEPNETVAEALARELLEEGGIALDEPAEFFGLYLNRNLSGRDHVVFYVTRAWRQDKPPKIPNLEIADCGFFSPDALPEPLGAATRRRLAEIRQEATISPHW